THGYRDALSVGYVGRHVLGVWVGRVDVGAVLCLTGYGSAALILFEAFARSGLAIVALPGAPRGAVRIAQSELPASLRRFSATANGLVSAFAREPAPHIVYPPEGAHVELGATMGETVSPLVLKLQ